MMRRQTQTRRRCRCRCRGVADSLRVAEAPVESARGRNWRPPAATVVGVGPPKPCRPNRAMLPSSTSPGPQDGRHAGGRRWLPPRSGRRGSPGSSTAWHGGRAWPERTPRGGRRQAGRHRGGAGDAEPRRGAPAECVGLGTAEVGSGPSTRCGWERWMLAWLPLPLPVGWQARRSAGQTRSGRLPCRRIAL